MWDVNNCHLKQTIYTKEKSYDMDISQDEARVAVALHDDIQIYSTKDKDMICEFEAAHTSPSHCVRYTPDENYLVSSGADSLIKVFDLRTRKLLKSYEHQ